MTASPSRVGVLFGGPSPEHDVSILTGLQAARALFEQGRFAELHAIYWSKSGAFYEVNANSEARDFSSGPPAGASALQLIVGDEGGFCARKERLGRSKSVAIGIDAIINCCHGGPGEDGSLQGALDLAGVCYTGPSAKAAAIGMDKLAQGALVETAGIPVLARLELTAELTEVPFEGPFIVKPRFGGSSIGIDVVEDLATARARLSANVHLRAGAVIEPYRPELYDLEVALLSYPSPQLSAIARPLRAKQSSSILSFADKYVSGAGMAGAARELPAKLDEAIEKELRDLATRAGSLLGARGVCRLDFLCDGSSLYFNEINTVPGSLSRYLFVDPPLSFAELLSAMLSEAIERPAQRHGATGADGLLLQDAASIAAKLA